MYRNSLEETKSKSVNEDEIILRVCSKGPNGYNYFNALLEDKEDDMHPDFFCRNIKNSDKLANGDTEKLKCKYCQSSFDLDAASAYSCYFHPDMWNGIGYRCCGLDSTSKGCKTRRHAALDTSPKKQLDKCSSCKKSGHTYKDCPSDPNTKTGENPIEGLRRINTINSCKTPKPLQYSSLKPHKKGFNDILNLKEIVKTKQTLPPFKPNRILSMSTEEEEATFFKSKNSPLILKK